MGAFRPPSLSVLSGPSRLPHPPVPGPPWRQARSWLWWGRDQQRSLHSSVFLIGSVMNIVNGALTRCPAQKRPLFRTLPASGDRVLCSAVTRCPRPPGDFGAERGGEAASSARVADGEAEAQSPRQRPPVQPPPGASAPALRSHLAPADGRLRPGRHRAAILWAGTATFMIFHEVGG